MPQPLLRRPPRAPALALCAGILLSLPLAASWEIGTYEQRYGPEAHRHSRMGSMFSEDIHVWAYTEAFSGRFRMPAGWVDPGLEGAAALAYALKWDTGRVCGHGGTLDCRRRLQCVLDVLFEGDRGDLLRNDLSVNQNPFGNDRSARFLSPQSEADFAWMQQLRASVDLAGSAHWYRRDASGQWHYGGEARSVHYERRAYGLTDLSLQVDCQFGEWGPKQAEVVRLVFTDRPVAGDEARQWAQDHRLAPPAGRIRHQVGWSQAYAARVQADQRSRYFTHNLPHDTHGDGDWRRGPFEPRRYEESFTPQGGRLYEEDPHVWAYTEAFAERFGMPREWITEGLEGVEALAFRAEQRTARFCGYGGRHDACRTTTFCIGEVYFPDTADIPWYEPLPINRGILRADDALVKLSPAGRKHFDLYETSQSAAFVYARDEDGRLVANVILTGRMESRSFSWWPFRRWEETYMGAGDVFEYERRLQGYEIFQINGSCMNWERAKYGHGRSRVYYITQRPSTISDVWQAERDGRLSGISTHSWTLPDEVMPRLREHWERSRQ